MTVADAPDWAARRRRVSFTLLASYGFTAVVAGALLAMVALFAWQSIPVWRHSGGGYLVGTEWFYRAARFGAAPMIYGTAAVSAVAIALAAPVGVGAAVFTAEFLPRRLRMGVKAAVELLAGVPSVVYGLLGILFLRQWVYDALAPLDPLSGDTLLTAGLLLAVMILPTVMTLSDDALVGVSSLHREAARGLGLTRAEAVWSVALPQAAGGIVGAILLALGRALGETIAVYLVVGRQDNQWPDNLLSLRPLIEAGQTLTSKLGGSEVNIAYGDPLHWAAVVGLGLILLVIVLLVTLAGAWLRGAWLERGVPRA